MGACLVFDDNQHRENALGQLNTLRKGGQFCDVILLVERREIPAHRAVLACASKYMFELFSSEHHNGQFVKLPNVDAESFNTLVNYAYTSKLEVEGDQVRAVYKTAMLLKMQRAADACSRYLASHLSAANCLGIRAFANSYCDAELTSKTDTYIQTHLDEVMSSPEVKRLPFIQVDIIGVDDTDLEGGNEHHLSKLVVGWSEKAASETSVDHLTERVHVLYLSSDNSLYDCSEVEIDDQNIKNTDKVRDYKKLTKNLRQPKQRTSTSTSSGEKGSWSPPNHKLSLERLTSVDREWKVIATKAVGDQKCMCIAMLDNALARLSINFRPLPAAPSRETNGSSSERSSPVGTSPRGSISMDKICSLTPLATMSSARCGVGTAVLGDRLLALGGYDRGECLNTVEVFDILSNTWSPMQSMLFPRGRFDVSQLQGKLFACGGSNGMEELNTCECYDPESEKWYMLPDMHFRRSSAGVAVLNGKLYVVGGWSGLSGVAECEVFDPQTKKWNMAAKLKVGRSQAGVCVLSKCLVAVGGCDAWNCINSAEIYDPREGRWTFLPSLTTPRRGTGVATFKGKLYVVGGSDGTSALSTVEVYDPETKQWSFGPAMSIARANVGVAVVENRLFAVGGFSGKEFLDSVEYLSEEGSEWCSFVPACLGGSKSAGTENGCDKPRNGDESLSGNN